jgi:hypothetical protein
MESHNSSADLIGKRTPAVTIFIDRAAELW